MRPLLEEAAKEVEVALQTIHVSKRQQKCMDHTYNKKYNNSTVL